MNEKNKNYSKLLACIFKMSDVQTTTRTNVSQKPRAQETSCRRCGAESHRLRNCTEACSNCRRIDSWCDKDRCTAKCNHCSGNHLARQCQQCSKCSQYGHCEKDCTSELVVCLRCEATDHQLKECPKKCGVCETNQKWCTKARCMARCNLCNARHLTDKCTKYRLELVAGQWVKVELARSREFNSNGLQMTQENFPPLS